MADGMQAFQTTLVKSAGGGTALTLGHLTSIGGLQVEGDEIEVTDFDSSGYREFIAGFKDAGEVAIEGNLRDEADFAAMLALQDAGTTEEWTITFKSGATLVFDGWVKSFGTGDGGMDDAVTYSGAIRVSGQPVFTPAA